MFKCRPSPWSHETSTQQHPPPPRPPPPRPPPFVPWNYSPPPIILTQPAPPAADGFYQHDDRRNYVEVNAQENRGYAQSRGRSETSGILGSGDIDDDVVEVDSAFPAAKRRYSRGWELERGNHHVSREWNHHVSREWNHRGERKSRNVSVMKQREFPVNVPWGKAEDIARMEDGVIDDEAQFDVFYVHSYTDNCRVVDAAVCTCSCPGAVRSLVCSHLAAVALARPHLLLRLKLFTIARTVANEVGFRWTKDVTQRVIADLDIEETPITRTLTESFCGLIIRLMEQSRGNLPSIEVREVSTPAISREDLPNRVKVAGRELFQSRDLRCLQLWRKLFEVLQLPDAIMVLDHLLELEAGGKLKRIIRFLTGVNNNPIESETASEILPDATSANVPIAEAENELNKNGMANKFLTSPAIQATRNFSAAVTELSLAKFHPPLHALMGQFIGTNISSLGLAVDDLKGSADENVGGLKFAARIALEFADFGDSAAVQPSGMRTLVERTEEVLHKIQLAPYCSDLNRILLWDSEYEDSLGPLRVFLSQNVPISVGPQRDLFILSEVADAVFVKLPSDNLLRSGNAAAVFGTCLWQIGSGAAKSRKEIAILLQENSVPDELLVLSHNIPAALRSAFLWFCSLQANPSLARIPCPERMPSPKVVPLIQLKQKPEANLHLSALSNSRGTLSKTDSSLTPAEVISRIREDEFGVTSSRPLESPHAARLSRALQRLSNDLYSNSSHAIAELLQNVDDNRYDMGCRPAVLFVLSSEGLAVVGNEAGFCEADVRALCDVGRSTKISGQQTGKFGIGFKAVFKISDSPHIFSNGYKFKFLAEDPTKVNFLLPHLLQDGSWDAYCPRAVSQLIQAQSITPSTVVWLPFRPTLSQSQVDELLDAIDFRCLLLFRRLEQIDIADTRPCSRGMLSVARTIRGDAHAKKVITDISLSSFVDNNVITDLQILQLDINRAISSAEEFFPQFKSMDMSFLVASSCDVQIALPLNEQLPAFAKIPVFNFLPVRHAGFCFLVHSPCFVLSAAREEFVTDDATNLSLINEKIPQLLTPLLLGACIVIGPKSLLFLPLPEEVDLFFRSTAVQVRQAVLAAPGIVESVTGSRHALGRIVLPPFEGGTENHLEKLLFEVMSDTADLLDPNPLRHLPDIVDRLITISRDLPTTDDVDRVIGGLLKVLAALLDLNSSSKTQVIRALANVPLFRVMGSEARVAASSERRHTLILTPDPGILCGLEGIAKVVNMKALFTCCRHQSLSSSSMGDDNTSVDEARVTVLLKSIGVVPVSSLPELLQKFIYPILTNENTIASDDDIIRLTYFLAQNREHDHVINEQIVVVQDSLNDGTVRRLLRHGEFLTRHGEGELKKITDEMSLAVSGIKTQNARNEVKDLISLMRQYRQSYSVKYDNLLTPDGGWDSFFESKGAVPFCYPTAISYVICPNETGIVLESLDILPGTVVAEYAKTLLESPFSLKRFSGIDFSTGKTGIRVTDSISVEFIVYSRLIERISSNDYFDIHAAISSSIVHSAPVTQTASGPGFTVPSIWVSQLRHSPWLRSKSGHLHAAVELALPPTIPLDDDDDELPIIDERCLAPFAQEVLEIDERSKLWGILGINLFVDMWELARSINRWGREARDAAFKQDAVAFLKHYQKLMQRLRYIVDVWRRYGGDDTQVRELLREAKWVAISPEADRPLQTISIDELYLNDVPEHTIELKSAWCAREVISKWAEEWSVNRPTDKTGVLIIDNITTPKCQESHHCLKFFKEVLLVSESPTTSQLIKEFIFRTLMPTSVSEVPGILNLLYTIYKAAVISVKNAALQDSSVISASQNAVDLLQCHIQTLMPDAVDSLRLIPTCSGQKQDQEYQIEWRSGPMHLPDGAVLMICKNEDDLDIWMSLVECSAGTNILYVPSYGTVVLNKPVTSWWIQYLTDCMHAVPATKCVEVRCTNIRDPVPAALGLKGNLLYQLTHLALPILLRLLAESGSLKDILNCSDPKQIISKGEDLQITSATRPLMKSWALICGQEGETRQVECDAVILDEGRELVLSSDWVEGCIHGNPRCVPNILRHLIRSVIHFELNEDQAAAFERLVRSVLLLDVSCIAPAQQKFVFNNEQVEALLLDLGHLPLLPTELLGEAHKWWTEIATGWQQLSTSCPDRQLSSAADPQLVVPGTLSVTVLAPIRERQKKKSTEAVGDVHDIDVNSECCDNKDIGGSCSDVEEEASLTTGMGESGGFTGDELVLPPMRPDLNGCSVRLENTLPDDVLQTIGKKGEQIVYNFLKEQFAVQGIDVRWMNQYGESGLPYDITLGKDDDCEYVEVKTSRNTTKSFFEISRREWVFAQMKGERYQIWRLFGIEENAPKRIVSSFWNVFRKFYKDEVDRMCLFFASRSCS